MENTENIGVFIGQCETERDDTLFWQLRVSVELVDSKTGVRVFEPVVSQPFSPVEVRSSYPIWNEILACNHSFQDISNVKNVHYVLLFELFDYAPKEAFFVKKNSSEIAKRRVAWAFLKPIGANNCLNFNQLLKLQLFSVGKKCSKCQHQTCELYHLYAEHKRKKYPGCLEIEVKAIPPPTVVISPSVESTATPSEQLGVVAERPTTPPAIAVSEWTRLPTQSCKIPNSQYLELNIGSRGVSCLDFSRSGIFLAYAGFSQIALIHIPSKKALARFTGHSGLIYELHFSPDDSHLLSVSADCSAIIWDVNGLNKTPLFILPHASFVYCGKWLKVQKNGLMTGGKDGLLRFWRHSQSGCELLAELAAHKGYVSCLEVMGNGMIISGDSLGVVLMWGWDGHWIVNRRFVLKEIAGRVVDSVHCHPGQRRLVITARCFGSIMLDVHAGAVVCTYPNPIRMRSISCLTPCGTLLFAFGLNNVINCWRFDDGRLLASYHRIISADSSGCICYHPFEHMMAYGVLGASFPCTILNFDLTRDCSLIMGLSLMKDPADETVGGARVDGEPVKLVGIRDDEQQSLEDKLSAIVKNIDRVLAVRRLARRD